MIKGERTHVRNTFMGERILCQRLHANKKRGRAYLLPYMYMLKYFESDHS